MGEFLQNDEFMINLDLKSSGLGCMEASILISTIMNNSTIIELSLDNNWLFDDGAKALSLYLNFTNLNKLYISDNRISDMGVSYICKSLESNMNLIVLNLSHNRISNKGACILSKCLKLNKKLTTLFLSENRIGDPGAIALSDSLIVNQTLTTLSLHVNDIKDVGASAIADALKDNSNLKYLYLSDNKISMNAASLLVYLVTIDKKPQETLEKLDLRGNPLDSCENFPRDRRINIAYSDDDEDEYLFESEILMN